MSDRCDKEIYQHGTRVFLTHTLDSEQVEKWVKQISAHSGQPVDWHYAGGRAVILALGDLDQVRKAIVANRIMHDEYFQMEVKSLGDDLFSDESIQHQIDGIWQYNNLG